MKFLLRKHKKRRCLSKNGNLCFKGYEYLYTFSSKGRNYLKWKRVQKPLEDLTSINQAKEILEHLPQKLKNRILTQAAIKSAYKYNGPSRQSRLIDTEAFLIAITLLKNQNLIKENFNLHKENLSSTTENHKLKNKINNLNEENMLNKEALMNAKQRINRHEQENKENLKLFFDFNIQELEQTQRKDQINEKFIQIPNNMINIYRKSRNRVIEVLYLSLPEEKFNRVMNSFNRLEEKERTEFNQKMNALA